MKLSDQEQVVLKAIAHVGRNGLAEVAKVVRAVGYPISTTKKILVVLNKKGAVSLHRHDWPQSLKPEDRKLLVKIGSNYYSAVSVREKNPMGKSKGKQALKTTGKALKGLAKGALSAGSQILGAGAMALNPIITAKLTKGVKAKVIKVKKKAKRNASTTVSTAKTAKRRPTASRQTGRKKTASRVRSVAKARKVSTRRATSNPTRKGMRKLYREAKRISKTTRGRYFSSESGQRKAARHEKRHARKSKRNNPSAESIRKEFAGSVNGARDLFFPQGTPSGKLAKLGKLVSITTEEGTIKPVSGSAWLCADTKGKLHIGSVSGAPLFDGPARSFGHVTKIEYESSKPHLGYSGPIIWFHRAGEENGIRPTLKADGRGGLVFKGGDYRLTRRGIEN